MSAARILRCPSRRSSATRCPPMKPPAPATTTSASLSKSLIALLMRRRPPQRRDVEVVLQRILRQAIRDDGLERAAFANGNHQVKRPGSRDVPHEQPAIAL